MTTMELSKKENIFQGVDKIIFDILDNIFQHRSDELYIQGSEKYKNGYCIRNLDSGIRDDKSYHFKIDISKKNINIRTQQKLNHLNIIHMYNGISGLGNRNEKELKKYSAVREGEIEYKDISPKILEHFKDQIKTKYDQYVEIELKDFESSIYKIIGIDRQIKIKKLYKDDKKD